jgi:MtN3 and saliva related transmembrane protein
MIAIAVGVVAAALSVTSFVPQAWRVIRTRETKDLATPMWVMNVVGFAMWTTYGVLIESWPIIVPNAICCVLAAFILVMKLAPRPTKHRIADAISDKLPGHRDARD